MRPLTPTLSILRRALCLDGATWMAGCMNQPGIVNDSFPAKRVRKRIVIIFSIRSINRLVANPTFSLGSFIDYLLLGVVEEPLRVKSNTEIFYDLGAPFFVVF